MKRWCWTRYWGTMTPRTSLGREELSVLGQHLPRGKIWQGLNLIELVITGPVLEEIIYRGFFVYCLGSVTANIIVALIVGLGLCLCLHLYQGSHLLHRHVAFYCVVVALTYSPFGLAGAIGFHIGCDLSYALSVPGLARVCRRRQAALIVTG